MTTIKRRRKRPPVRREDVDRIRTGVWDVPQRHIRCLHCQPPYYALTTQAHIDAHAPATCSMCMRDMWVDDQGVLVLWGHPGGGMGYV